MPALSKLIERRAIDASVFDRGVLLSEKVHAGVPVDQQKALRFVAVYSAVGIIADAIASMPTHAFRKRDGSREMVPTQPQWLDRTNWMPNPETDAFTFNHRIINSLCLDGNAFVLITARDRLGFPQEVWNLNPQEIRTERRRRAGERIGELRYIWQESEILSRYSRFNPGGEVLHIKAFDAGGDRGLSPIDVGRQAIGLGLVTEKFGSRFFGKGQHLSGVIEAPSGMPDEAKQRLVEWWKEMKGGSDNAFEPGVLTGGATWKPIAIAPENAQFLQTRKFQVNEIARLYRVPPHLIADVERSTSWGSGIEEQNIAFLTYTLLPWLMRVESGFNQMLPRGQFVKFNTAGLLRGDVLDRFRAYAIARQNGWLSANEIRELEDMNRIDGLDDYWQPTAVVDQTVAADQARGNGHNDEVFEAVELAYQGVR